MMLYSEVYINDFELRLFVSLTSSRSMPHVKQDIIILPEHPVLVRIMLLSFFFLCFVILFLFCWSFFLIRLLSVYFPYEFKQLFWYFLSVGHFCFCHVVVSLFSKYDFGYPSGFLSLFSVIECMMILKNAFYNKIFVQIVQ